VRSLVVNADDFGFSLDVNRGIVEAHTRGILTATTLMANGDRFEDAVSLARAHPSLDIGVHCVLVQGKSLATGHDLPNTVGQLLAGLVQRRIDPYRELRPQVERILEAGIRPSHLDTHKHTHLYPSVLDAVARLSEEFQIPWVRRPFDFPLSATGVPFGLRITNFAFQIARLRFHAKLAKHGCRTTDHFAGFQLTGRFRAEQLITLFRSLPEGSTEFMCHPGFCTDELRCMPTRLKEAREQELQALVDPKVRAALAEQNIRLTNYAGLT
jgi:chitin disaccharide deacetylase